MSFETYMYKHTGLICIPMGCRIHLSLEQNHLMMYKDKRLHEFRDIRPAIGGNGSFYPPGLNDH